MKKIKEILGGFWKIWVVFVFMISILILYPVYLILLNNEKYFKKGFKLIRIHSLLLAALTGIVADVKNKDFIQPNQPYVIVPNHTSYLDIVVLNLFFKNQFVFMGKIELSKIPIFSIFFKKFNIPVNRKSVQSGKKAMDRCAEELKKGNSVVLFPEGTISKEAPNMLRFKNGAFKLAIEQQIPLLPITFLSNYKRLEMGRLFSGKAGPGIARAIVHQPISTKGLTQSDIEPLRDKVYKIINDSINEPSKLYCS